MDSLKDILDTQGGAERFRGFARPTTTPTPDEVFDRFLTELTHSELKVLLYIIRRTFGFRKNRDRISLAQLSSGIKKRNGQRLDKGTGLSRRSVIRAVQSLEKRGLIRVGRVRAPQGDNSINVYSLRFRSG